MSTTPRMLKAARTLASNGYDVTVVSATLTDWAALLDQTIETKWKSRVVETRRRIRPLQSRYAAVRSHALRAFGRALKPGRLPDWALFRANARTHPELVREICRSAPDFIYGGTRGGIAAAADAARICGTQYALDLEDFHSEETGGDGVSDRISAEVERRILAGARFITAGSEAIADAYAAQHGVAVQALHNVFPLPELAPEIESVEQDQPLRLYWFSQTIGHGRGLEDAIIAAGLADVPARLVLQGTPASGYEAEIRAYAATVAPKLTVVFEPPAPPDAMTALAANHDVGLSLEQRTPRSRDLCLTNKIFTYMLGGLALVMTDTAGHRGLIREFGANAAVFVPGQPQSLSRHLRQWALDRETLRSARAAAWAAAVRRWHWDHAEESGKLLRLVAEAVGTPVPAR